MIYIGSYGSIPTPVSEACKAIADEVEANPDKFIKLTYEARWIHGRQRIADLIGAEVDECVLVPNTSHGVDTVLRSIDWKKGDIIAKSNIQIICSVGVTEMGCTSEHYLRPGYQ